MGQALRFAVLFVIGLGFVTWGASVLVDRTTHDWFEKDVGLRAQLAVSGARRALIGHWHEDPPAELRGLLSEITHDERILAAAACNTDLTFLARTKYFPDQLTCGEVENHIRPLEGSLSEQVPWRSLELLPGGNVHASATPVLDRDQELGFVVLVHDLSFVQRRAAKTRLFLITTFGFLAPAAAAIRVLHPASGLVTALEPVMRACSGTWSSLHDGMNLVAKEFVAAREDEGGVLVLSQFTGAARELTEALIVNPYDIDEVSSALAMALNMSEDEKRDRMRSMRAFISEFNVYRWAGRMLVDAARLRTRDRVIGRLTDHFEASANVTDSL